MNGINVSRYHELRYPALWARVLAGFMVVRLMNWLPVTIPVEEDENGDIRPIHDKDGNIAWMLTTADEIISNESVAAGFWFGRNGYPPLRWQIALCNALGAKVWLCIPHTLSDAEAAKLIRYVAALAEFGVIVEWSNEVWNFDFWAVYELGGTAIDALMAQAQHVIALRQMTADLENVDFVFATWANSKDQWHTREVLKRTDVAKHVTAIAIAPYFGMKATTLAEAATDVDRAVAVAKAHVAIAGDASIECWHYEQGQHVEGMNSAEINRSPQMGALMCQYDNKMAMAGSTLRNWYSGATAFGHRSFGIYETKNGMPLATAKVAVARRLT